MCVVVCTGGDQLSLQVSRLDLNMHPPILGRCLCIPRNCLCWKYEPGVVLSPLLFDGLLFHYALLPWVIKLNTFKFFEKGPFPTVKLFNI